MDADVVAVLVAYHTPRWIKVALRSFQAVFPKARGLVVDNNPDAGQPGWEPHCEEERAWLARTVSGDSGRVSPEEPSSAHGAGPNRPAPGWLLLKNDGPDRSHGGGLDQAVAWCRREGAAFLLHFEPDCLVLGRGWYDALREAVDNGAWMAGSHRKGYGPIHPAPSLWRVDRIGASFSCQPRGDDERHPRFHELFDLAWLTRWVEAESPQWSDWWSVHWDTGQKNWFQAAVADRAALVPESPDFHHFWCGSGLNRHAAVLDEDPQLVELQRD